jgi:YfiH family protein
LSAAVANPTAGLPALATPFRWRSAGEVVWLEAGLDGATAAFSTRLGGESEGPYRSLNLGILTDDEPARVEANRQALCAALGRDPAGIAMGRQVHGTATLVHDAPRRQGAPLAAADGHVAARPDLTPLVLVADCVPLLLAAPGAVAAVHCGWRGVAGGIVGDALARLREVGGVRVAAALGPGIGPCCYEVGEEVAQAFAERGHGAEVLGNGRLDLAAAITAELQSGGVAQGDVASCGLCTSCNPELFFSHRRDGGRTGRQAGLAWLSGS